MSLDSLNYTQVMSRTDEGDKMLVVAFFNKAVQLEKLDDEGKPVFQDREYIRIEIPGSKEGPRVFQANSSHKQRFPAQYKAFQENRELPLDGTPIEELAGILDSQLQRCKAFRIRTIEQLANIADEVIDKLGPNSRRLHENAVRYVKSSSRLEQQVEDLKAQNQQLLEKLEALMEQAKPKRNVKGKADEHSNDDSERSGQDGLNTAPGSNLI